MTDLSVTVTNDTDRLQTASRAPVNVFLPALDTTQHVSDYEGNYWPFRTVTLETAAETDDRDLIRTLNRSESFHISLSPGSYAGGPLDLFEAATNIGSKGMYADAVIPRPIVTGRGAQFQQLLDAYDEFDFTDAPSLILPITRPYKHAAKTATRLFTPSVENVNSDHPWANEVLRHPPRFGILNAGQSSVQVLSSILLGVFEQMPGDVELHLSNVYPTVGLAALLRHHENLVQSLSIAPEAVRAVEEKISTTPARREAFSRKATRDLQTDVDAGVALATEFSFLCSQYVADEKFSMAATESIVPFSFEDELTAVTYDREEAFTRQVPPDMVGAIGEAGQGQEGTRGSCLTEFS